MTTLADEIEAGPASRDLSDRMLIACGWIKRAGDCRWFNSRGEVPEQIPDPTRDLNAIASLEKEMVVFDGISQRMPDDRFFCSAAIGESHPLGISRANGDHAEPRVRCAALWRALDAAGQLKGDAS